MNFSQMLSLRFEADRLVALMASGAREELDSFSSAAVALASSCEAVQENPLGLAKIAIAADNGQALSFLVSHPAWVSSCCPARRDAEFLKSRIERSIADARANKCLAFWSGSSPQLAWSLAEVCCSMSSPWIEGALAASAMAVASSDRSEAASEAASSALKAMLDPFPRTAMSVSDRCLINACALDAIEAMLASQTLPSGAMHAAMAFACAPSAHQSRAWEIAQASAGRLEIALDKAHPAALGVRAKPTFISRSGFEPTLAPLMGRSLSMAWLASAQATTAESAEIALAMARNPKASDPAGFPALAPKAVSDEHPLMPMWTLLEHCKRAGRPLPERAQAIAVAAVNSRISSWLGYFPAPILLAWRAEAEAVQLQLRQGVVPADLGGRTSPPLLSEQPTPSKSSLSPLAWTLGMKSSGGSMDQEAFAAILTAQAALGYSATASLVQCELLAPGALSPALAAMAERAELNELTALSASPSVGKGPRL